MNTTDTAYWSAAIAPSPPVARRYPNDRLEAIVEEHAVALRGWNYPHIPRHDAQAIVRLPDGGLEAHVSFQRYQEQWRFHPSGLFTHRWRLREEGTSYQGTLHFVAAIYTVAEVIEFGRRLFHDDDAVEHIIYRIGLDGVLGRRGSGDSFDDLPYHHEAKRNSATYTATVARLDLVADAATPAVDATVSLFGQLGFTEISRSFIARKTESFLAGRR